MPSLSSDAVETVRASIESSGALDRPKLVVPEGTIPEGVVRVDADGSTYHAHVETSLQGEVEIRGLYENARLARKRDGENRLESWVESAGLESGRSALVDVVVDGEQYGLRAPGEDAVYRVVESPDESLSSIAEDIDG